LDPPLLLSPQDSPIYFSLPKKYHYLSLTLIKSRLFSYFSHLINLLKPNGNSLPN
jgi:hypothetical protein